ncbi:MAG: hypothetical protein AB8G96_10670 [Phycisphaerales bacterium]
MTKRGKRRLMILVVLFIAAIGGVWGLRKFRHYQYEQQLISQRAEGLEMLARGDLTDEELDQAILYVGSYVRSDLAGDDAEAFLGFAALRVQRPLPGNAHISGAYAAYASVLDMGAVLTQAQEVEALEGIVVYAPMIEFNAEAAAAAADLILNHDRDTDPEILESAFIAANRLETSVPLDRIAEHLDRRPPPAEGEIRGRLDRWGRARIIADALIALEPESIPRRIARLKIDQNDDLSPTSQLATIDGWIAEWIARDGADGRMHLLKAFTQTSLRQLEPASATILEAADRGASDPIILSDMLGALRSIGAGSGNEVAHREREIALLVSTIENHPNEVWPWERRVWWSVRTANVGGAMAQLRGEPTPLIATNPRSESTALQAIDIPEARPIPAEIIDHPMIRRWEALAGLLRNDMAMIENGLPALKAFAASPDAVRLVRSAAGEAAAGGAGPRLPDIMTEDPAAAVAAEAMTDSQDAASSGDRRIQSILDDLVQVAEAFVEPDALTQVPEEDEAGDPVIEAIGRLRLAATDALSGNAGTLLVAPPAFMVDLLEGRVLRARGDESAAADRLREAANGWVAARLELASLYAGLADHDERVQVLADLAPGRVPAALQNEWIARAILASLDRSEAQSLDSRVLMPGGRIWDRVELSRQLHELTQWSPIGPVLYARSLAMDGMIAEVDKLAEDAIVAADPATPDPEVGLRPTPAVLYQLGETVRQLGREAASEALLRSAAERLAELPDGAGPSLGIDDPEFLSLQIQDGLAKLSGDLDAQIWINEQLAERMSGTQSEIVRWNAMAARIRQGGDEAIQALAEATELAESTNDLALLSAMLRSPAMWSPPRAAIGKNEALDIAPYRNAVDIASSRLLALSPPNAEQPRVMRALYLVTYDRANGQKQAEALDLLDQAEDLRNELSPDAAYLKALVFSNLGGKDREIVGILAEVVDRRPGDARTYGLLLPALRRTGDRETLGRIVRRMQTIFGDRPDMQPMIMASLLENDDVDGALAFFREHPDRFAPSASSLLASQLLQAGRIDEAADVAAQSGASPDASTTDLRRVAIVEGRALGSDVARERLTERLIGRSDRDVAAANAAFDLFVVGRDDAGSKQRALKVASDALKTSPGDAELFQLAMSAAEGLPDLSTAASTMKDLVLSQAPHLEHSDLVDGIVAIAMQATPLESLPESARSFVAESIANSGGVLARQRLAARVDALMQQAPGERERPTRQEVDDAVRTAERNPSDAKVWVFAIRLAEFSQLDGLLREVASQAFTEGPATAEVALSAFGSSQSVGENGTAATAGRLWVSRSPAPAIRPRLNVGGFLLATNQAEDARAVVGPLLDLDPVAITPAEANAAREIHLRAVARSDERTFELQLDEAIDSDLELSRLAKIVVDAPLALAREALTRLETQIPGPRDLVGLGEAWTILGVRHEDSTALDKAIELVSPLMDSDVRIGAVLVQAQVAAARGDDVEAERWYREALVQSPGNAVIRNNLAATLVVAGRNCSEAVELTQGSVADLIKQGEAVRARNRLVEAALRGTMAEALACVGDADEAMAQATLAVKLAPSNPSILAALAIAQKVSGSESLALATARDVREQIEATQWPLESAGVIRLLEQYEL